MDIVIADRRRQHRFRAEALPDNPGKLPDLPVRSPVGDITGNQQRIQPPAGGRVKPVQRPDKTAVGLRGGRFADMQVG